VEDNESIIKFTSLFITRLGVKFYVVRNGAEAISELRKGNEYDIIFMDIQMPVMNGLDASLHIRELESQNLIKGPNFIVAMTAVANNKKEELKLSGIDCYLTKPFTKDKLENLLHQRMEMLKKNN